MNSSSNNTADIVILGAGVMGASIAFHLAQRKAGRIVVLEKDNIGQGGSGRSSALVRMHYSFPPEVMLAVKSLEMFNNWKDLVGETGDFHRTGFLRIVPETDLHLLQANVNMQKSLGVNVEIVDRAQLQEIEPEWNFDDVTAAAYEPDSGYGDGSCVANDFMAAAREKGVEYRRRTPATSLLVNAGRIQGVKTEQGYIEAPIVIGALGPWCRPLLQQVGVHLPIENEFHEVVMLRNPPDMEGGGCACIDSITTTYFRSDASDKTLVGDFYGKRGIDPDNFPQRPAEDSVENIVERTCRRMPMLQHAEMMRGVTGVYDMSPDSRPLLGEIPGIQGLHVAAGFSGMGFKISPAIGLVFAELLLDGAGKTVDIAAFRPSRFAEGHPIKAEFEYADD
jgi:sarcosine oxidase, subunit beta